ncbi:site-specific DNA-methyltransferase [Sulfitobacter sp. PR48]|uniref:site-specific DNA-methyltransferase n=1 Tax=Sulfitobacter sp. PR48 TaxID=3028383 RepID=UPI00237AB3BE|nr:site-specific DNA-methyltransferase [Sulfitobacter sp. PR48]MDD9722347.1 site-specific DNA-methyltransferase [Sulfitobacter sp. PR48]
MSDEIEKLKMHSPDLTAQNVERIAALFPGCVTESRGPDGTLRRAVDFDLLRQELSDSIVDGPQERYHLDWPGKRQALITANAPIAKTLRPVRAESVEFDTTRNLFIEGDNLEALKLLQETYLGKVKMIYIDPPYNTGKDFIYEDDFSETSGAFFEKSLQVDEDGNRLISNTEANGRFHSDWLSMIYSRIRLARNMLTQDGLFFVSIDDNELVNLSKACDEIFGPENLLCTYTIKVRYEGKTLVEDMLFQKVVENVLVYAKSRSDVQLVQPLEDYSYDKFCWQVVEASTPRTVEMGGKRVDIFEPDGYSFKKVEPSVDGLKEIWATGSILDGNSSGRFFRDHLGGRVADDGLGVLYKVWGIGDDQLPYRYFTGPKREGATKGKYFQGVPSGKVEEASVKTKPIITFLDLAGDFGNCRHEGGVDFRSGKKPVKLINDLASIVSLKNDDVVLDFFAGSGTAGHAVRQISARTGLNLRSILVQLPEKIDPGSDAGRAGFENIAEITKERIRRAGAKILEGECHPDWNRDVGFRVLKIDSSNMADVYYTPDATTQADLLARVDKIKPDRSPEDLLFQVLLDWGVDLTLPITRESIDGKTVFTVAGTALIACFDNGVDETLVKTLATRHPLRVVFKDTGFKDDATKINVKQIFKSLSPDTDVKAI